MNKDSIIKQLKHKLENYYQDIINKDELSIWAKQEYYKILHSKSIQIEHISVISFLKTISTFNVIPNDKKDEFPCSEDEVLQIKDIIVEGKSSGFIGGLRILTETYENSSNVFNIGFLSQIKAILLEYIETEILSDEKIIFLKKMSLKTQKKMSTIVDILELQILGILNNNILYEDEYLFVKPSFNLYSGIEDNTEYFFINKIVQIIDYLIDSVYFRLYIEFQNGNPYISIV